MSQIPAHGIKRPRINSLIVLRKRFTYYDKLDHFLPTTTKSNRGPLESEATALPTEPQPLTKIIYF